MSGAKRRTKYRKQVESDILDALPEPETGELIVEMIVSRGGNILEVRSSSDEVALCRLPAKFRHLVWVKRGSFLIVARSSDDFTLASGRKGAVLFDVRHVLYPDQIKHLHEQGLWPTQFESAVPRRRGDQAAADAAADATRRKATKDAAKDAAAAAPDGGGAAPRAAAEGSAKAGLGEALAEGEAGEGEYEYESEDSMAGEFQNNNRRGGNISSEEESSDEESDVEE